MKIRLLTLLLTVTAGLTMSAQSRPAVPARAAARTTPPLVVLIVADQFRGDYVQLYGHQWTKGLRRLFDSSAYFPLAKYPYSVTLTCAGHVTIGTGAFPQTHGMIANDWFDRATRRRVACTNDPTVTAIGYGGRPATERHSAQRMLTNTFADELRNQAAIAPRVVSMSLKARSAIGLAGHAGDLVMWEEDDGTWATSTAFASAPRPEAEAFAQSHVIARQYGRIWDRLMPPAKYLFTDDGAGELKLGDGTTMFPHAMTQANGLADLRWVNNWERTPFVDEMLADMAIAFSDGLGQGAGTDVLAVSFSALDLVGHHFGPKSHEVQDVLARLDVQIGRLLETLDRRVGAGRYVVALSSDHGVAPVPEQVSAMGLNAGRFRTADVAAPLRATWAGFVTDGVDPIANAAGSEYYFTPAALAAIEANPAIRRALTATALALPGIDRAYWADDVERSTATDDPILRSLRLSYFPGRSPDLRLIPKTHWMASTDATTHGTPYAYDQRVPVLLMGFGITPGRYLTDVSPADIAPTLAALTGIILPRAEGRVLTEALRR